MDLLHILLPFLFLLKICNAGLFPKESETREVKKLDGVWNFRTIPIDVDQNIGFTDKWYSKSLSLVNNFNQ